MRHAAPGAARHPDQRSRGADALPLLIPRRARGVPWDDATRHPDPDTWCFFVLLPVVVHDASSSSGRRRVSSVMYMSSRQSSMMPASSLTTDSSEWQIPTFYYYTSLPSQDSASASSPRQPSMPPTPGANTTVAPETQPQDEISPPSVESSQRTDNDQLPQQPGARPCTLGARPHVACLLRPASRMCSPLFYGA